MKIGILGGTFDPIHEGHLALARAAKEQFELAKVLFIPAFIPPHKTARRDLTPAPYRYRMVEMAIRDEPDFELSDVELSRPEVSYTLETLRGLRKKYPNHDFFFIMGSDMLAELPNWHEPEEICKLTEFLVAPRKGEKPQPPGLAKFQWVRMSQCPLSSSQIREKIRQGKPLGKGVLPRGVADYIQRMKLYQ